MNPLFECHQLSRQDMLCELIPSLLLKHSEQVVEDGQVLHITALKPFLSLRPAKPTESFLLSPARRPKRKKTAILCLAKCTQSTPGMFVIVRRPKHVACNF